MSLKIAGQFSMAVTCAAGLTCAMLPISANAQSTIPGVFSTGVDSLGNLLPGAQIDPHYTITSSPLGSSSAYATSPINPYWGANTVTSAWINQTGDATGPTDDEPAGTYVYTLTFNLVGFNPATANITGEWLSDDSSSIWLNGVQTAFSNTSNTAFAFFTLNSGFTAGVNTLQFYITQIAQGPINPEGLQANIFTATAVAVPEPAPVSLSLIGCLSWFLIRKLKKQV
jgi:hypothetical protein